MSGIWPDLQKRIELYFWLLCGRDLIHMASGRLSSKIVGLGAGGHAKVVIEILLTKGDFEIAGLLDVNPRLWGSEQMGIPVLGSDDLLPSLFESGIRQAFIGVGSMGTNDIRRSLYERARQLGFKVAPCIHPNAVVSPSAVLGDGPTILAGAVINAAARIGVNVIVNTGAIVEHDCVLGDHSHIAPGARLASAVTVGEGAHIGIGASVRQCIRIGRSAIVGAGAAVVQDVPDNTTVVGVPARPLRRLKP
jgi:sugar O-acyltransferase (sialic acid O-acetyltransferase NeuD family)